VHQAEVEVVEADYRMRAVVHDRLFLILRRFAPCIVELSARARFECGDLWSAATKESIESVRPHLLICNPPYIPEPQGLPLELEAAAASQTLWESSPTASTRGPFIHTSGRFRAPG
jgi:hypothetical protein